MGSKQEEVLDGLRLAPGDYTTWDVFEHILKVIQDEPRRFNYGIWMAQLGINDGETYYPYYGVQKWPACGTVACFYGWGSMVTGWKGPREGFTPVVAAHETAANEAAYVVFGDWLGLTPAQARALFLPADASVVDDENYGDDEDLSAVSPDDAVAYVRRLMAAWEPQLRAHHVTVAP